MTEVEGAPAPLRRNLGMTIIALAASGGTLLCCVLPVVMVSLGMGAALAGLVAATPQLVWLSQHKAAVFGVALITLSLSSVWVWRARLLPCPIDRVLAQSCMRLRKISAWLLVIAWLCSGLGVLFAFVLPYWGR